MSSVEFYGDRLLEAREARGYSLQQVADHLGITRQAVSLYERSMRHPRPDYFQKLVEYLRVPPHYFSRPPLAAVSSPRYYRSLASATKKARDAAEQKAKWLREVVHYLSDHVELAPASLPPCALPSDPNRISNDAVEDSAIGLRRFWNLGDGVISNVVHLLENKGIVVARFPLESDKLDAFSFVEDDTARPYIILAADKNNCFRSRHDAAHELGHLLLHRNVPAQALRDPPSFDNMESQAHRFASAFLLPARTFGKEWITSDINSLRNIKLKWKSAIQAMIMRAADLGMISDSQKESLQIAIRRNHWRRREPFDDDVEPEQPLFWARACMMIIGEMVSSKTEFQQSVAPGKADIEMLLGLPGFFDAADSAGEVEEPSPVLKFPKSQ